ncbi:type VI immunity family protein [Yoonia sp. 2307UL14-13]|uniref:type VI immunity family protein n=1 Tax=Yoonia sp. 2307UL14-13 TaxID=3126506 RepID=UPI00309E0E53
MAEGLDMGEMDFNPSEVLEAIAPTVMHGKSEYVVGRICFSMMFFMPADGNYSTPPRMVEAEQRVATEFPREIYEHWVFEDPYARNSKKGETAPSLTDRLANFMTNNETHYNGAFGGKYWVGRKDGMAPPVQFLQWYYDRVLEKESHAELDEANIFQLNIPLTVIDDLARPKFTQKLFSDLCQILQPLSAVGGLCMATPLAAILQQKQKELETLLPITDNHPGLLFGSAFNMSQHTRFRMSAVNWLTAIRGDLLELCGGRDGVLDTLTRPGIETAPYGDAGLLIQAGETPQMGNLAEGVILPHYGDVARALRPARLHIDGGRAPHVAYYGPEATNYSDEKMWAAQNAWLARFDEMV